eukprot:TRINITY_DN108654_c0_g1_i1.p1 TRINITY_DN108654_c0_g1~~TRINITY_DN108654_c0_g1_i1.p1  ORF type:complete len:502 (+),score=173.88 TRINITY_DN108654_c0_g1_i1:124-1629(+)
MPHCQKEFSKPPVSSKKKKEEQKAKKEAAAAKAAKRAQEDDECQKERDPEEVEAERIAKEEADKKELVAKKLKDAKAKGAKAFKEGDMVEALAHYSECVELDPEDHVHWSNRAAVRHKLGLFDEALMDATKCTELSPEFIKGWARVGAANLALGNLDAAEEAFQKGLALEEENSACLEGLKDVEKAREPSLEDKFEALVKQLKGFESTQLRTRALEEGLEEDKIEEAELSSDPKEALVSLITAHRYLIYLITEELQGLSAAQLRARALEEGVSEDKVREAEALDDPSRAITALVIKHLCNDLVDVAAEEVQEECDAESEEDAEDADIDFEIVTMDESDLQLADGEVFLAGAFVDQEFGELVLPNGTRLGNRALAKFYKQRARPVKERQLAMPSLNRIHAKIMKREERRKFLLNAKGSNTSTSTAKHVYKYAPDNKAMRAIVHHWGAGGGGSHYWGAGGKQYNQGNKIKGIILRHSVQGAKTQAQRMRNKQNRGNKSIACLQ